MGVESPKQVFFFFSIIPVSWEQEQEQRPAESCLTARRDAALTRTRRLSFISSHSGKDSEELPEDFHKLDLIMNQLRRSSHGQTCLQYPLV